MKKPRVHVTDHAVLRYLERVFDVDVEGLRQRIGRTVDTGVKYGATGVKVNGINYRLRGARVITLTPINRPKRGQRRRK